MPTLPSGLKLDLHKGLITEPARNGKKAPEGHFWYWLPAPETPPPFGCEDRYDLVPKSAPVPPSRAAAKQYIQVLFEQPDGKYYWRGEMLSEFPKYGVMTSDDIHAWLEWLDTETVQAFFDDVIAQCATQAEINQEGKDYVILQRTRDGDDGTVYGNHIADNPLKSSH